MSGIYYIKNLINNKVYIGSATDFNIRSNRHKQDLNKNIHHSIHLQRAWNKYGPENFIFEIIDTVNSKEELIPIEQAYLDFFNSNNRKYGYNICKFAGSSLGFKHTDEAKNKMSKNHAKYMLGRKHTKESKKKMSEGLRGRRVSKETKEKMSKSHIGIFNGENHPGVKLNNWKVRVIRFLLKQNKLKQCEISEIFEVSKSTMCDINFKRTWRHII